MSNEIYTGVRSIELALRTIVDESERQLSSGGIDKQALNTLVSRQYARQSNLEGIWATDAAGNVLYGTGQVEKININLKERSYYRQLRDNPYSGLIISEPVVGRTDNEWDIILARRINAQGGNFAGIAFATVNLEDLSRTFAALDTGRDGVINLFNDEFTILARHPVPEVRSFSIWVKIQASRLRDMIVSGQRHGLLRNISNIDGIERLQAFRKIQDLPLTILVGVSTEIYLAQWRDESAKTLVILFVLLSLGLSILIYRALKRQALAAQKMSQVSRAANAERELNRIIVQSSPLAIYTRDKNGLVTAWNQASERMFGWSADEVIGKPLPTIPAGKEDECENLRRQILDAEQTVQIEVQRQKRDGSLLDLITTLSPLRNASGKIEGYLAIAADITQRRAAEKRVEYLAQHDVLTELPNRLLLQDRFRQAAAYADRDHTKLAMLFLDLDHFKSINDSLGHPLGDALLKEVAKRLNACLRSIDTISRQGGDEFVIVLSSLPDSELVTPILAKLQERLQQAFYIDGNELTVSTSIGVAVYPDDGKSFDVLLKKADMAMYRAKAAGRNTYRFFDEQMNVDAVEQLDIRTGLKRALDREEFVLHYQPQVNLATGKTVGAEALLRWARPGYGFIQPSKFISVAEESGLIVPIGDWVIQEACRQAAAWNAAGLKDLSIAVNMSAMQFKRGDLEQIVIGALEKSGLAPQSLELELTESVLIQDVDNVLTTMKRLKALGVKLSIDDFGTGYSSLSYLKRLNVDKLKIDQSFIQDLATDPDDRAIVTAVIQMARSLKLKTLAEGVENADILPHLRALKCDEAQGYYFSEPLAAHEFFNRISVKPGADMSML